MSAYPPPPPDPPGLPLSSPPWPPPPPPPLAVNPNAVESAPSLPLLLPDPLEVCAPPLPTTIL